MARDKIDYNIVVEAKDIEKNQIVSEQDIDRNREIDASEISSGANIDSEKFARIKNAVIEAEAAITKIDEKLVALDPTSPTYQADYNNLYKARDLVESQLEGTSKALLELNAATSKIDEKDEIKTPESKTEIKTRELVERAEACITKIDAQLEKEETTAEEKEKLNAAKSMLESKINELKENSRALIELEKSVTASEKALKDLEDNLKASQARLTQLEKDLAALRKAPDSVPVVVVPKPVEQNYDKLLTEAMREYGLVEVSPELVMENLSQLDRIKLNIAVCDGKEEEAKKMIHDKLESIKERMDKDLQKAFEQNIDQVAEDVVGVMKQQLDQEVYKDMDKLSWGKVGRFAKGWLLNAGAAVGVGIGAFALVTTSVATAGLALPLWATATAAAAASGGVLAGAKGLYHKFFGKKRDQEKFVEQEAKAREKVTSRLLDELQKAEKYQEEKIGEEPNIKVGLVKQNDHLANIISSQTRLASGTAAFEKFKGAHPEMDPANMSDEQVEQLWQGQSTETYNAILVDLRAKHQVIDGDPRLPDMEKLARHQTRLLGLSMRNARVSENSVNRLRHERKKGAELLGRFLKIRGGKYEDGKKAEIAGTAVLGAGISAGLCLVSSASPWGRLIGLGVAGTTGAIGGWAMGHEKGIKASQELASEEVDNIINESEKKLVDVYFPKDTDKLKACSMDADIIESRLNMGLLDASSVVKARAEGFVYNVRRREGEYIASAQEMLTSYAESGKTMQTQANADLKRIEEAIKKKSRTHAFYEATKGVLTALATVGVFAVGRDAIADIREHDTPKTDEATDTTAKPDDTHKVPGTTKPTTEVPGVTKPGDVPDTAKPDIVPIQPVVPETPGEFHSGDTLTPEQFNEMVIHRGEGYEHALHRQLESEPDEWLHHPEYGIKPGEDVHHWAGRAAHQVATDHEIIFKEMEKVWETRVRPVDGVGIRMDLSPDNSVELTEFTVREEGGSHVIDEVRPAGTLESSYEYKTPLGTRETMAHPYQGEQSTGQPAAAGPAAVADNGPQTFNAPDQHTVVEPDITTGTTGTPDSTTTSETQPTDFTDLKSVEAVNALPESSLEQDLVDHYIHWQLASQVTSAEHPWNQADHPVAEGWVRIEMSDINDDGRPDYVDVKPTAVPNQYQVDFNLDGRPDALATLVSTDDDPAPEQAQITQIFFDKSDGTQELVSVNEVDTLAEKLGLSGTSYFKVGEIRYCATTADNQQLDFGLKGQLNLTADAEVSQFTLNTGLAGLFVRGDTDSVFIFDRDGNGQPESILVHQSDYDSAVRALNELVPLNQLKPSGDLNETSFLDGMKGVSMLETHLKDAGVLQLAETVAAADHQPDKPAETQDKTSSTTVSENKDQASDGVVDITVLKQAGEKYWNNDEWLKSNIAFKTDDADYRYSIESFAKSVLGEDSVKASNLSVEQIYVKAMMTYLTMQVEGHKDLTSYSSDMSKEWLSILENIQDQIKTSGPTIDLPVLRELWDLETVIKGTTVASAKIAA